MILKDYKRLANVDFLIADVSRQAVCKKSIRHGHPSKPVLRAETP